MHTVLHTFTEAQWTDLAHFRGKGTEFDWIARDQQGELAVFTSAGAGPIPDIFWNHLHDYNALVDRINSLPAGEFIQVLHDCGNCEDWQAFAALGLYAFDYHDVHRVHKHGGYDLMTRPGLPIKSETMEPALVTWLPRIVTSFSETTFVSDHLISRLPGSA